MPALVRRPLNCFCPRVLETIHLIPMAVPSLRIWPLKGRTQTCILDDHIVLDGHIPAIHQFAIDATQRDALHCDGPRTPRAEEPVG